jgi:hypothetical protein
MISPEYVFSLLPTGFFIFLIQQQCENVCYLLIDYIVYMVNNQSNRAQGSGLLRRVLLFWTRSENESELGVFSSVYRWRRRRLKRKCCLRFRSLSQHEIESIYYVGQGLWEIYNSRFIFSKRYKTILTFPFLSLFLLKMGISNKNQNTKEEISTIRHSLKRRK